LIPLDWCPPGCCPQSRAIQLCARTSGTDNVTLGSLHEPRTPLGLNRRQMSAVAKDATSSHGTRASGPAIAVGTLSGGITRRFCEPNGSRASVWATSGWEQLTGNLWSRGHYRNRWRIATDQRRRGSRTERPSHPYHFGVKGRPRHKKAPAVTPAAIEVTGDRKEMG
jgi:hypothetical protein